MCGPVTLSRGIKQGHSISSQLYIMSIEPLLMHLRNEPLFQVITLPLDGTIKLTAMMMLIYMSLSLVILISSTAYFLHISQCLMLK